MSQQGGGAQEAMQKFGRFLSGMVMPNIGAFIAWGFLTALFIPTGWMPNEYLAQVGAPMSKWLIPLLIGYSGGAAVYGHRGGVMAAIATSGIIAGSEIPMFLGAMIMGPLGGYLIKKFDNAVRDSIPGGFEMLVNNFSLGIFGGILAMIAFAVVGPVVSGANNILRSGVEAIVAAGLLPLASIIIEPAKVLFLNNALNHGVLSPLGIQQAQEYGKSMFFLLEANPGPGFGILLAYWMFGKGMAKSSSPGAMIIHVLGGIHEIYFPYILMKPILIIAAIAGGMSGVFTLGLLGGGLIAPSSPGSIFAIIAMTPNTSALVANLSAFAVATAVSCAVASVFIKMSKDVEDESLESAREDMAERKNRGKELPAEKKVAGKDLKVIVYACDAGMGSSALGAAALRKKLKKDGYKDISVTNCAIGAIPQEAQLVISHEKLAERALADSPQAEHIWVRDFTQNNVYEIVTARLKEAAVETSAPTTDAQEETAETVSADVLRQENVKIGLPSVSREEAITAAGKMLVASGYVDEGYVQGMLNREHDLSTYIGKGIAIPHGENAVKDTIKKTGIVVCQYPDGVKFGDETAYLVIGIAGVGNDHLAILANIATMVGDYTDEQLEQLFKTKSADELYHVFTKAD
ncbi:PTS mannitol transporter subunit IICBA [Selenomonas sp. oral taxon 478]|uniref:PTS mannitol transporter subunit IICBA n=1 Tax=Selenomonas sp. oral taxon 478 TaxID=712538 RepID=UPI000679F867|nr:PTS mannitol transporter subunit IICBA [Selenomonas sp. oral taxon 478]AKT54459.1 PTS system mannitol-specific transporter subunit IICBA [Selenomonas sp. oral taxon 478]